MRLGALILGAGIAAFVYQLSFFNRDWGDVASACWTTSPFFLLAGLRFLMSSATSAVSLVMLSVVTYNSITIAFTNESSTASILIIVAPFYWVLLVLCAWGVDATVRTVRRKWFARAERPRASARDRF